MDQESNFCFPRYLLDYFASVALTNLDKDGHIETLAIALGKKTDNLIEIQELIFPEQIRREDSVIDKGMFF